MSAPLLERVERALLRPRSRLVSGRVVRCSSLVVEAILPGVPVGASCDIHTSGEKKPKDKALPAQVVGFSGPRALLMPLGDMGGIREGSLVVPSRQGASIPMGEGLFGRVVDSAMEPVDDGPRPSLQGRVPVDANPPLAMRRRRIHTPLTLGIRAIDTLLTLGEGQRVGILAGPGVGKSVLLGMVARHCQADVIVVGLVGERGREVREFIERDLGPEGLRRSVVVVATSDAPPLVRVRAALAATAVAEYHRARGRRVMLLLDSLTRVAMAQREIGLAAGEPPTSKGYPPSTFALLPRLLERAGNHAGPGSISALYTVLAEGDDLTDPVVDCARAALDGHIVLSRKLAGAGHFPAVDVLGSVSRVMTDITSPSHQALALAARETLSVVRESADLVEVGAYVAGTNPKLDRALACIHSLNAFLRQRPDEFAELSFGLEQLRRALEPNVNVKESRRA